MADFDFVSEFFGKTTTNFGYYAKARDPCGLVNKNDLIFVHCNIITDVV